MPHIPSLSLHVWIAIRGVIQNAYVSLKYASDTLFIFTCLTQALVRTLVHTFFNTLDIGELTISTCQY